MWKVYKSKLKEDSKHITEKDLRMYTVGRIKISYIIIIIILIADPGVGCLRTYPGPPVRDQGPGSPEPVWALPARRGPQEGGLAWARQDAGALPAQGQCKSEECQTRYVCLNTRDLSSAKTIVSRSRSSFPFLVLCLFKFNVLVPFWTRAKVLVCTAPALESVVPFTFYKNVKCCSVQWKT